MSSPTGSPVNTPEKHDEALPAEPWTNWPKGHGYYLLLEQSKHQQGHLPAANGLNQQQPNEFWQQQLLLQHGIQPTFPLQDPSAWVNVPPTWPPLESYQPGLPPFPTTQLPLPQLSQPPVVPQSISGIAPANPAQFQQPFPIYSTQTQPQFGITPPQVEAQDYFQGHPTGIGQPQGHPPHTQQRFPTNFTQIPQQLPAHIVQARRQIRRDRIYHELHYGIDQTQNQQQYTANPQALRARHTQGQQRSATNCGQNQQPQAYPAQTGQNFPAPLPQVQQQIPANPTQGQQFAVQPPQSQQFAVQPPQSQQELPVQPPQSQQELPVQPPQSQQELPVQPPQSQQEFLAYANTIEPSRAARLKRLQQAALTDGAEDDDNTGHHHVCPRNADKKGKSPANLCSGPYPRIGAGIEFQPVSQPAEARNPSPPPIQPAGASSQAPETQFIQPQALHRNSFGGGLTWPDTASRTVTPQITTPPVTTPPVATPPVATPPIEPALIATAPIATAPIETASIVSQLEPAPQELPSLEEFPEAEFEGDYVVPEDAVPDYVAPRDVFPDYVAPEDCVVPENEEQRKLFKELFGDEMSLFDFTLYDAPNAAPDAAPEGET
ncbi:hypothetical protein F5Y04DRAFT_280813 [Hypomontagnella monticulosa]|nr:hypothetical protein F5Y04DRAFT_280813 [Hypomontagnella monticulosa]